MTFKEKYNSIDQTKLPENAKSYMAEFKKDSDNFTNKQAMALMMPVLDRFIKGLKDSGYGDAVKGGAKKETKKAETPKEMAKEIVEEAVEQPETKTGKPKVGKISKGDFMKIAKEIRKEGEPWNDAMKRAGEIIRTQKEVVKKEATRQYEKLKKFIEKHPEVYPMDIPVRGGGFRKTTINRDAPRVALAKGKRVSKAGWKNQYGKSDGGKTYYEYRSNRYDTRRQRYPFLEKGGEVEGHKHVLHIDGQNWFLEKIDSTHFYMSNDRNHRGMAHHIGQHKGEPYYEEVREWLKTTYADGGEIEMGDNVHIIAQNKSGVVTNVISNGKHFSVKFIDGTKNVYDKHEIEKILDEGDYDEYAKGGEVDAIFAKGGKIEYIHKNNQRENLTFQRYNGAIGQFMWWHEKRYNWGIIYPLDNFDIKYYSHLKLKPNEVILRYRTDTMIGDVKYLVKFNLQKLLVYFMDSDKMSDDDDKNIIFQGRGLQIENMILDWDKLDPSQQMNVNYAKGGYMANGGSIYDGMSEKEFLNKYWGANVFFENPSEHFDIKKMSSSNDDKIDKFIEELKREGYSIKKKSYSDFTSVMGVRKKMAKGGEVDAIFADGGETGKMYFKEGDIVYVFQSALDKNGKLRKGIDQKFVVGDKQKWAKVEVKEIISDELGWERYRGKKIDGDYDLYDRKAKNGEMIAFFQNSSSKYNNKPIAMGYTEEERFYAKGGELDMNKYAGAGMFAHGGIVKNIREDIKLINSRLKSLEETNTEEAYQRSEMLRKQKANLEALLLTYEDNPEYESRSIGATYYARGGYMSKGELVWNKLSSAKRHDFLHKHFHPEMTPRSIEILVNKSYNFLPKKIKIKMESVYANVEEYAKGGETSNKLDLLEKALTEKGVYVERFMDMEKTPYLEITSIDQYGYFDYFFFINKKDNIEIGIRPMDGHPEKEAEFNSVKEVIDYIKTDSFTTIAEKRIEEERIKAKEKERKKSRNEGWLSPYEKYKRGYAEGGEIEYGSMVLKHDFPKYKRKPATTVYLKPDTSKIVKIGGLGEKGYNLLYKDGNNSNLVIKQTDLDKLKNGEIIESSGAVVSLSDKYAEGGYIAMGENYEYTNYFGIEQDDFENIVEIWHKWENISENNPNFNSVKEEYLSMLKSMESKYGADKFNKVLDYIEETHLSHREEEVKSDLIDEINDMNQESFMNLCDNMGFEPNDWELFVNAMDYNNAEELLNDIRNGDYEVSEYDADEYAKGGVIGNFRVVPYKRIEVKNNPDLIEPYYSLAFTINGTLSEAEQEAQEYVKRNSPEIVSATITKIHPSGQPLKHKKVAYITKDEISKYAKGGEISDVKIGDILIASTGVKVKVVDYDSMFGGRVKVERMDEYATGKPSQWMPVTNFKKFAKGGSISKSTTYIPNRNIESIHAKIKDKKVTLKGKDILDGVYAKNEALNKPFDLTDAYNEIANLSYDAWDTLKIESGSEIYSSDAVQKKLANEYEKIGVDAAYMQYNAVQRRKIREMLTDENQHSLRNYFALRGYDGDKEYNDYKNLYEQYIKEKRKIFLNPANIEHQPKKKFAKGGKIGFKGLSEKVAKYYANKSVPSKYQSLYGKKYDKAEAKEVGDKVAAKVYRQQQSKKK